MTFTGGSWRLKYVTENTEFTGLVTAYLTYRRSRKRYAYWLWFAYVVVICGAGTAILAGFSVSLASLALGDLLPEIENRGLEHILWAVLVFAVALGFLFGFRRLNAAVETPVPSGGFEYEITVTGTRIISKTRGMTFDFDFENLRDFVELKHCFCFVHPMTVIVFIPKRVFVSEAIAAEFSAFCQEAMRGHG